MLCGGLFPQNIKVINLWKSGIPDAIFNSNYSEDTVKLDDGRLRIRHVTNPTLTIYKAEKQNPSRSAVIIAPGGGYTRLAMEGEGSKIAEWLNSIGITAIVLKYRLPNDTIMKFKEFGPLQDAQESVRVIRSMALELNIDPAKIGFLGGSAGGHLAASLCTHFSDSVYNSSSISARPDFAILLYPVITMDGSNTHSGSRNNLLGKMPTQKMIDYFSNEKQVTPTTPPTIIFAAADDASVPIQNSLNYFDALQKKRIRSELHIFQSGGHGFGLGKGGVESGWPLTCTAWLRANGFIF